MYAEPTTVAEVMERARAVYQRRQAAMTRQPRVYRPKALPKPKLRDQHDAHVEVWRHHLSIAKLPKWRQIVEHVIEGTGVTFDDLKSPTRNTRITFHRHLAMARVRAAFPNNRAFSMPAIGRLFGGKDHTSVLHAIRVIAEYERLGLLDGGWEAVKAYKDARFKAGAGKREGRK